MGTTEVGNKYRILDAKTGEEKKGKYFCLRIDANDPQERSVVEETMLTYVGKHRALGNREYANKVIAFINARG